MGDDEHGELERASEATRREASECASERVTGVRRGAPKESSQRCRATRNEHGRTVPRSFVDAPEGSSHEKAKKLQQYRSYSIGSIEDVYVANPSQVGHCGRWSMRQDELALGLCHGRVSKRV